MVKRILPADSIAVLYLRMSDERQERSIADQRAELLAYAAKHGYTLFREYADPAISGDDTARRTEFLRMREDAAKGEFSVVLCWDQDRFGRFDPIEGGHWILPFRNAGVRLETIAQGKIDWNDFAGRLIYLVQQEGKHAYLRDLSRNSIRGQIAKAKDRKGSDGSCPFGYRSIDGIRVVVKEQAEIVRRIFREYLKPDGGLRGIANRLNADGIPSPTGKTWTSPTIRAVVRNKKHCGTFVWGKQSKGRYFANQDGEIVPRTKDARSDNEQPIEHEGYCTAIVDTKTFDKVQRLLADRQKRTSPIRNSPGAYLLSGLLRCANCGFMLCGRTSHRKTGPLRQYTCSGYHHGGSSVCGMNAISKAPLVAAIVRLIEREYLSDKALDRLRKAIRRQRLAGRQGVTVDPKRIKTEIADLDWQIDQGADRVFSAPAGVVETLYVKLEKLRIERERLQAELAGTKNKTDSGERDEQTVEEAIRTLRDLRGAIRDADPEDTRRLLSSIVSKIELRFKHYQRGKTRGTTFSEGTIHLRPDSRICSNMVTLPSWPP